MELQIWVVGDLVIAILSLSLHHYYAVLQEKLDNEMANANIDNSDKYLDDLRQIQMILAQLVQTAGDVFSPLILFVFGCNVSYILVNLYSGIEDEISNPNILVQTAFVYSFSYVVIRLVSSTLLSAPIPQMVLQ